MIYLSLFSCCSAFTKLPASNAHVPSPRSEVLLWSNWACWVPCPLVLVLWLCKCSSLSATAPRLQYVASPCPCLVAKGRQQGKGQQSLGGREGEEPRRGSGFSALPRPLPSLEPAGSSSALFPAFPVTARITERPQLPGNMSSALPRHKQRPQGAHLSCQPAPGHLQPPAPSAQISLLRAESVCKCPCPM